jgi:predicted TIM-barrel fold metal-dependent hydrolase
MAIDCHAHWIPPELAENLRTRRTAPRIEDSPEGEVFVTYQGRREFHSLGSVDGRLALMDKNRVQMQVISLASLFGVDSLPLQESLPLVTAFNDGVAVLCQTYPTRFAAIAALPLADIRAACRELERSHALGLRGAILPADGFATLAAAEPYRPLFAVANRLRSHFFVHPGPIEPQPERIVTKTGTDNAWQRRIALQAQARLSEVTVTLDLSDFLDPYPDVTVQIANLGGSIPFLAERMDAVHRDNSNGEATGLLPSERLRRCYVDCSSFGSRAIELAVSCFGADRILLGTDCPIFDTAHMLQSIADARIDPQARHLLLDGNAHRIFRGLPV